MTTSPQFTEYDMWDLFGFQATGLTVEGYPVREWGRVLHWRVSVNCIPVARRGTRDEAKARVRAEMQAAGLRPGGVRLAPAGEVA